MIKNRLGKISREIDQKEQSLLSPHATINSSAFRKIDESEERFRPPFAIDRDRIMYSGAFRRYTGKTQVVYFASLLDEQLTSRSLHTISVAQIAKTIGRLLSLNVDLIDAIALGHDLGHPPFGHDGEKFLSEVSIENGIGYFHHNIQSLRTVDTVAKKGQGLNLTFQTRDGIVSHNGEVNDQGLSPFKDKKEDNIREYIFKMEQGEEIDTIPQTLEGCVVRLTDTIAYIGQDIEDAIRIGLISRDELPQESTKILGSFNGEIIETLVADVVNESVNKNYVTFSGPISNALFELKKFNYEKIYKSPHLKINHKRIKTGFKTLFEQFMEDLKNSNSNSEIFTHFLDSKNENYLDKTSDQLKVRDFIAGMTDRYFTHLLKKIVVPDISGFEINT